MKLKKTLFWIFTVLSIAYFLFDGFNRFYFLRQPTRNVPHDDSLFVSPANGRVIKVIHQDELTDGETELYKENNVVIDDWTRGFSGATLVSIMMTPLDAHFQKAPLLSKLVDQQYHKGHFFNATKTSGNMDSTFKNEYNNMLYITPEGYKFRIVQIAGIMAWRIVSLLEPNDIVEQGQYIGAIKLGSQVSVVLDSNFEVKAKEGDYVIDGETVIATKKDTSHIDDDFDEGNIVGLPDVNLDIDNDIRYGFFEVIHPSMIASLIGIIILIVQIFTGLKIFEKVGIKKWKVLIPIYNLYLIFKVGGKGGWVWSLFITPVIFAGLLYCINMLDRPGILTRVLPIMFVVCMYIPWIIVQVSIAKKFGKSTWFGIGLGVFPTIFYPYLAFIDQNTFKKD